MTKEGGSLMLKLLGSTIAILFALSSSNAFALPTLKKGPLEAPSSFTDQYDFEGIVALDDCSGSLIRFVNSLDTDPAMVLTNGHCLESGMPTPGQVITGQASSRSLGLMDSSGNIVANLTATQVLYSTMTGTDITLYRTAETYAEILSTYGIHPFLLSQAHPQAGVSIEVISGYWQRGYSCNIDGFVNELKEGDWTWNDSIRYSSPGCLVVGGTSGSPVIQAGTRNMIGINNTGNESGEECTVNNPCEVDINGKVTYKQGLSYGEETNQIYTCVNAHRDIDLSMPGCELAH
jgi:V8-like Glu-specific endopeptidase